MIKELKSLWIEDLESGEYKQCQGRLSDGDGYCCLGVLLHRTFPRSGIELKDDYGFAEAEVLSRVFREAIELSANNMSHLILMNDGDKIIGNDGEHIDIEPKTFEQIAQWLRGHEEV